MRVSTCIGVFSGSRKTQRCLLFRKAWVINKADGQKTDLSCLDLNLLAFYGCSQLACFHYFSRIGRELRLSGVMDPSHTTLLPANRSSMFGETPRPTWRLCLTLWWTRKTPSSPLPCRWGWESCQIHSSSRQSPKSHSRQVRARPPPPETTTISTKLVLRLQLARGHDFAAFFSLCWL